MLDSFTVITDEIEVYLKDIMLEKAKCRSKEEEDLIMLKLDVLQELGRRILKRMAKNLEEAKAGNL